MSYKYYVTYICCVILNNIQILFTNTLIMCSSFRLGCPSEYRTLIYATVIVNCWGTVRMCAPWGVIWWLMYSVVLRDPLHGGLNEFFHTGRTRHFFLQVWCGVRVAHGQVILRACDLVNCRLTVCLYRFSPCRQTSWKTCANSHVDVFHEQM